MTLLEEAGQLIDDAVEALRRGRTQAATDYLRQAKKLYEADVAAVAEENRDLAKQVEELQHDLAIVLDPDRPSNHWQRRV